MASTVCVAGSTRGATNEIGLVAITLPSDVEDLHRQPDPQFRRAIDRHLDVRFETALSSMVVITVERRHAIAFAHRDVADDARRRGP